MNKYIHILYLILFLFLSAQKTSATDFKMLSAHRFSGLIPDIEDGYGVSFRDFNNDGYPDVYLVCFRNLNRFLVNNGGIIPFIDRTIYSGLGGNLMPRGQANLELGSSAADYDNDGRPDIFLAGWGKSHTLFHNQGKLKFTDATAALNLNSRLDANQGLWLDVNNDGYLDLYITDEHYANRLLLNLKNGAFAEMPWSEGFRDSAVSQGACSGDFDGDGDQDIYVCNWFAEDYLLLNDGQGHFRRAMLNLSTLHSNISTNSATCADMDNDGDADLLVAGRNGLVYIYKNNSSPKRLHFDELHPLNPGDSTQSVYGILAEDFNQDGWTDCFLSVKGVNRLYLNNGRGSFEASYDTDGNHAYSTGCAAADLDRDGDLDIFVANKDALSQIYLNPVNNNHFIGIRLRGNRSNREGIGSKVYFYVKRDTLRKLAGFREMRSAAGYLSSTEALVHFGTGDIKELDIKIIFPSGKVVERQGLLPGREYSISEYGAMPGFFYSALRSLGFLLRQRIFWLDAFLILVLISLVFLFTKTGQRRYRWSTVETATLFSIWFIFALIVLLALRNFSATTNILAVNGVAVSGMLIAAAYSEYNLRLRKKRQRFRRILQNFSERMITIHENKNLLQELNETFLQHSDIRQVCFLKYKADKEILADSQKPERWATLESGVLPALSLRNLYFKYNSALLQDLFSVFDVNIFIPVWRAQELFGMIALQMENSRSALNQEDVRLLLPLANQLAIAIENNDYIEKTARLVKQLTEAEVREEYMKQLEESNRRLDRQNAELTRLFRELQDKEAQLVHSEKMASLGQLVAGISHELNNPVSFLYANSKALEDYLQELQKLWAESALPEDSPLHRDFGRIMTELQAIVKDNLQGSKSVKELVLDLRNFSRLDQAEWKKASLVQGVENSLKILKSQIPASIKIIKDFKADPLIYCNPGQMNQVFVNLIGNALQAVDEKKGKIVLRTFTDDKALLIQVQDNGKGISKENLPRIFEPFFTTKEVNKGTGLGLSISYSIVQKHGGRLTVESKEGQGSIFTVQLPLKEENKK